MEYYDKLVTNTKFAYLIYNLVNFNDFHYNDFIDKMKETFTFDVGRDYENTVILNTKKDESNPDYLELTCDIVAWICDYCNKHSIKSLVVGVSGGIDSAVSSTLAAKTGLPVYAVGMPINQNKEQETLSDAHLFWLEQTYPNVTVLKADLSEVFGKFVETIGKECGVEYSINKMAGANSRSRLRMVTLYQIPCICRMVSLSVLVTRWKIMELVFTLSMVTVALILLRLLIFIKQK